MNNAVMRGVFTRIGFSESASQALVEEQGMSDLEEIKLLSDEEVESLCKVIRRPGGTVPNPAGGAPIPAPGVQVNMRAEGHLKLLAFYLRHQERVSRAVQAPDITLPVIRTVRELREFESTYKHPTGDLPTINPKDWPKTMESIEEYLRSILGERKIPLAYVVRKNEDIPQGEDPPTSYPTKQDEMIARAPHYSLSPGGARVPDPVYLVNREKVWEIIASITREKDSWTYVRPAQRHRDGRAAYQHLFTHFLGPNNVDNMATTAEDKLKSTVYNGEQRRWDFERYVNVHKQQHSVLEGLVEHGYAGIDPRSKVRYLLDGIKTDKFDAVKTRIMSEERLRNDFDACVTLYQDYIRQASKSKTAANTVNISELKTGKRKIDQVEDRYYTKEEYSALTSEQKKDLASKRLKRGHKPGEKDSKVVNKSKGGSKKDVINNIRKVVNRQVAQLAKQMSKAGVDDETADSTNSVASTDECDGKCGSGGNRNNPSLTRQKRAKIADPKK
ncbi:hypothetical protein MHU86_4844 [Fragilaria crotonensis]|nr:hypothetical protein MHU86_4844 [Fragilaria crotonensis]